MLITHVDNGGKMKFGIPFPVTVNICTLVRPKIAILIPWKLTSGDLTTTDEDRQTDRYATKIYIDRCRYTDAYRYLDIKIDGEIVRHRYIFTHLFIYNVIRKTNYTAG